MVETHRNNNKAFPNNWIELFVSSSNANELPVCHVCKQMHNLVSGSGYAKLVAHLSGVHKYETTMDET